MDAKKDSKKLFSEDLRILRVIYYFLEKNKTEYVHPTYVSEALKHFKPEFTEQRVKEGFKRIFALVE